MLYFGPKYAPQAKILDFDTEKFRRGGFPERGDFLSGGDQEAINFENRNFDRGGCTPSFYFYC